MENDLDRDKPTIGNNWKAKAFTGIIFGCVWLIGVVLILRVPSPAEINSPRDIAVTLGADGARIRDGEEIVVYKTSDPPPGYPMPDARTRGSEYSDLGDMYSMAAELTSMLLKDEEYALVGELQSRLPGGLGDFLVGQQLLALPPQHVLAPPPRHEGWDFSTPSRPNLDLDPTSVPALALEAPRSSAEPGVAPPMNERDQLIIKGLGLIDDPAVRASVLLDLASRNTASKDQYELILATLDDVPNGWSRLAEKLRSLQVDPSAEIEELGSTASLGQSLWTLVVYFGVVVWTVVSAVSLALFGGGAAKIGEDFVTWAKELRKGRRDRQEPFMSVSKREVPIPSSSTPRLREELEKVDSPGSSFAGSRKPR